VAGHELVGPLLALKPLNEVPNHFDYAPTSSLMPTDIASAPPILDGVVSGIARRYRRVASFPDCAI